VDRF